MRITTCLYLLLFLIIFGQGTWAQNKVTYKKTAITVQRINTFDPKSVVPDFYPRVINLEAPAPGGTSYRSMLRGLKSKMEKRKSFQSEKSNSHDDALSDPLYFNGFTMSRYVETLDSILYIPGGTPLDNTLAISNDDFLVCGVNSSLIMHDLRGGIKANAENVTVVRFEDFTNGIPTSDPFDPKLLYDPIEDRFIATFLTGRNPGNSGIIVGFSTTNNPTDPWNVYLLPGNPLNNNTWTDYPAIALTEKELFLTVNLLVPGGDWKTSFSSTVIWQIDKQSGYNNNPSLTTTLWSDIATDGRNLRNLCPIQGGSKPEGPNMYLLSNRNFDLSNDSIFMVEVTNVQSEPSTSLNISILKADNPYGLPPNGRQANSNPNDPDDGFDTNDARILGGFVQDNTLYFVGNTKDFEYNSAGVYHGVIHDLTSGPSLTAQTIGDPVLDFGYPNIAFTGQDSCSNSSIISFNHTSPVDFSGTSALRYSDDHYSEVMRLVVGGGYVQRLGGSYERWGDYYGIQRKYNEPGVVWTAGFYGLSNHNSATWITELRDCDCFHADVVEIENSTSNLSTGELKANTTSGIEPFKYDWYPGNHKGSSLPVNLNDYDVTLVIEDAKFCKDSVELHSSKKLPLLPNVLYPNPAVDEVSIYFTLEKAAELEVIIYAADGKLVKKIIENRQANAGKNLITFSAMPLSNGMYIVQVMADNKEVFKSKLIVP